MSRRSTAAASAERAAKATTSRHISLLWPPMIWVIMWLVAEGAYLLFHYVLPDELPFVAGLTMLGLTIVCGAVFHMSWTRVEDPRRDKHALRGVVYATGTAIASSLWLFFGMIANPLNPGLATVWGFGLFPVVLWVIRMVMERTDAEAHQHGQPSRRGAAAAFLEATAGVAGVDAHVIEATPSRIDIGFDTTDSDVDLDVLRGALPKVAAAAGVGQSRAVVLPNPAHAGQGTLRIVLKDILAEPIPWPGPANPGGTPFDFYPRGLYIDTIVAGLFVADQTGARHEATVGTTGSGKGGGARVEIAEHISREEVSVAVIDTVKQTQTMGPLAGGLDWLIIDQDTARSLLGAPLKRALQARFRYLAAKGLDHWKPGCGLQFWVIVLEEASDLEVPEAYLEDFLKFARSAGVRIRLSQQSSLYTQMSTTVRRMLTTWSVYGCQDDFEASNLPDAVRNAGAAPEEWRDEQPGMNYLVSKGIPIPRQATALRDYNISREQMLWVAREYGSQPLDDVTANELGGLYLQRPTALQVVERENRKALGQAEPRRERVEVQQPAGDENQGVRMDDDDEDDGRPTETDLLRPEELGVTTPYEGHEFDVTRQDVRNFPGTVPPGEDFPIGPQSDPTYKPDAESTEWMRAAVDAQIDLWEDKGQVWIRPADFIDTQLCGATGPRTRGRTWFDKDFKQRLVPEGRLERDTEVGKYRIIPKPLAQAS